MEILIFASRVIRSKMRCYRSSWNRAEGWCCWVLVFCSVLWSSLCPWASQASRSCCYCLRSGGCKGPYHSPGFSLSSLSGGALPQTPNTFKRIARIIVSLKTISTGRWQIKGLAAKSGNLSSFPGREQTTGRQGRCALPPPPNK